MKRKLLISLIFSILSYSSFAQINSNRDEFGNIVAGPYITNSFWDNIFITPSVGAFMYMEDLGQFNNLERASFIYKFDLGKWITPTVGVRLRGEYAPDAVYESSEALSTSSSLKFNYSNVHADFLWNFSNVVAGYRHKRAIDVIPYIGVGYGFLWTNDTENQKTTNFNCNFGLITKIRVSNTVAFNLEVGTTMISSPVYVTENIDFLSSATFGITINFAKNKRFERYKPALPVNTSRYQDKIVELTAANQELVSANSALQAKIDTLETPIINVTRVDASPVALFFEIGRIELDNKQLLNLDFYVKNAIRLDKDKIFVVTASADNETGSTQRNAVLSEDRMNYIANILLGTYSVPMDRIILKSDGDLNNRFDDAELNRVVVIE